MPIYDRQCDVCTHTREVLEAHQAPASPCPECGGATQRVWTSRANSVIGDDIPGGMLIHHGLCNADGSPRRYYSKTDMAREAKRRGLVNHVVHLDRQDGRKSPTSRWV